MNRSEDYQLIQQYLKGDETAMAVLVQRYMAPIYRFVYRYVNDTAVAEDITQDVFLKLWKHLKNIEQQKSFKSWIYTVAKNTALDYIKKKKSLAFSKFEDHEGKNVLMDRLSDGALLPDELAVAGETKDIFLQAIDQLSEKYKEVFTLYYYEYLNFREIAEALKEPINTIKSRHRRGLVLLKQAVDEKLA